MSKSIGTGADGLIDPPEGEKCLIIASGRGMNAPPDCRYAMKTNAAAKGVSHRHCGYILYTGKPRGCEPGRGCSRYDNGKKAVQNMPPAGKPTIGPPRWAAPARELWEDGISKAEIARRLGITWSQVDYRRRMHWEKGEV